MSDPHVSGMESLDNLTDKTQRFLIVARDEGKRRNELLAELKTARAKRDLLLERHRELESSIADLESRRTTFDDKVTTLIDALGEIPLRDIG